MSMRSDYEAFVARKQKVQNAPMARIWVNQTDRYVHPFNLYGPIWYVGDSWVCVHLIDTGDGLLMIDSGNCGCTAMLVQAIWEAGFNPANVKWIVHSHGHVDHIGGANFFKKMYGSKLYIGARDAKMFRQQPELALVHESTDLNDDIFVPDHEIADGEVITFGNLTLTFYDVPGHTEGCIAFFGEVDGPEGVKRIGYHGGFGFNTLSKAHLTEVGDTEFAMRHTYLASLAKVRDQKVEIFLGNHCINNDTLGRHAKQLENPDGPNPFVDDKLWGQYLDSKRDDLLKFMADPNNN